jgi:PIN domain nuclease of toxin-antitoxin system
MNDMEEILLLDTHIWIWLMTGSDQLKNSPCIERIDRAISYSGIRVSVISGWEVGMLESKGKLRLRMDCLSWVQKALCAPGISLTPVTPEIAVESSRLPGTFHGDPADRIIVSTARIHGATLITRDRNIITYGRKKHVKIVPA